MTKIMIKKTLLFFTTLLCAVSIYAANDTVNYSVVRDDPTLIPKLYIGIIPIDLTVIDGVYATYGITAEFDVNNKFSLRGKYSGQYTDELFSKIEGELDNDGNTPFEFKNSYFFTGELGFDYVLSDQQRTSDTYITISSSSTRSGNVTFVLNNVLRTKIQHRKVKKLRLGGIFQQSSFKTKEKFTTTDGTIFNAEAGGNVKFKDIDYRTLRELGYSEDDIVYNEKDYSSGAHNFKTNQQTTAIYVGYSVTHITNKLIDVENYGLSGLAARTTFYVDATIGFNSVSPFSYFTSNPFASVYGQETSNIQKEYAIDFENSDLKFNPFGFRAGFYNKRPLYSKKRPAFESNIEQVERLLYLNYYLEAGLMPAPTVVKGLFVKLGISIDINPF